LAVVGAERNSLWNLILAMGTLRQRCVANCLGEPSGAKPGPLKNKYRLAVFLAIILATLALAPILKSWGAASTYADAILFFGSLAAQILMVYEKYESWILWLIVDIGYVALYASQGLLFTTLLYVAFTVLAAIGWGKWYAAHRRALGSV